MERCWMERGICTWLIALGKSTLRNLSSSSIPMHAHNCHCDVHGVQCSRIVLLWTEPYLTSIAYRM